ncbi:MAG TPA: Maf family protein [Xanthomonadales bacterium]|nr:Maf family protein [Xanthomonadales bacterium]
MNSNRAILLASASPRRRDLLDQIGVSYRVQPADIDESPLPGEAAEPYTLRIAREKVIAGSGHRHEGEIVLAADTSVVVGDRMLGKPVDQDEAFDMLSILSGATHQVFTAVSVMNDRGRVESCLKVSDVEFAEMGDEWIRAYIETGEPMDKAGAYGIQGWAGAQIRRVNGSYSSIMGLPLFETAILLGNAGLRLPQIPEPAHKTRTLLN